MPFLIILLMGSFAFAQNEACSEIDLNKDPSSLGLVPKWEQGDTQLCYAFTTAQLVDAYRIKTGELNAAQFMTSPLVLASQTIQQYNSKGTTYRGGKIEHAFKTAREKGSCNAKFISDRWGKKTAKKVINLLSQCYARNQKEDKSKVAEECLADLIDEDITKEILPSKEAFEKFLEHSKEDFISSILSSPCKEMHMAAIPPPKRYFRPKADTMNMVEKVNQLLVEKIPVGVNFCAEAVGDKNHVGHRQKNEWICNKGLRHSAIISGRKNIDGKCHFLIRDSGCESLNKTQKLCENGEYYIEEKHLVENSEGLIWLE
jgi:hypothetical protein